MSFISFEIKEGKKEIHTISATVRNFSKSGKYGHYISDHAEAKDVVVRFFDGAPREGKQIGDDRIISRLLPLEVQSVSVDWDTSRLQGRHVVYVQVLSPVNVVQAGLKKKPATISRSIDLDAHRRCGG
jgi:hypothetical protein